MIRLTFTLVLLFLTAFSSTQAQQLPLVAQHEEYHGLINAASLNSDFLNDGRNISFGTSWRQQWVDLGALSPSTQVVRGECVNTDYKFVVGGYFVRDKVGITNNTSLYVRAAYIIPTGEDITESGISIGLNLGIANWQLHTERLSLNQLDDPNLPYRPSSWYPDIGFGAYWYQNLGTPNHYFYMGLSMPRTFDLRSDYQGAKRLPHYYGLLGYYMPLPTDKNAFIEVSAWSRYVENVPLQNSFHFKAQPMESFFVGFGFVTDFKSKPLTMFEAGVNIPMDYSTIKIGYSYTYGSFLSHFGATHELNLSFVLDNER